MVILEAKQQNLLADNKRTASGSLTDQLTENIHLKDFLLKSQLDYYALMTYAVVCPHAYIFQITRWKN